MKKFKITSTLLSLFLVLSLVATTAFAQAPITSTLRQGNRGNQVVVLQNQLNKLGFNSGKADGIFGRGTRNAVMAFQRKNGLKADGIVGRATRSKLFTNIPTKNTATNVSISAGIAQAPITSTLRQGSRGNQVTVLQNRLNQLGFNCGRPDGVFGRGTRNAVMAFQRKNGLKTDGIVGKGTIAKLFATPNTNNPNNPNTHKPNTSNTISKPVKIYFKDVDTNKDISSVQTKNISLKNGEAKWIEEVGPQTVNGYAFAKSTVSYNDNPTPNQFHNPNTRRTVKFVVSSKQPHHSIVFLYKKQDTQNPSTPNNAWFRQADNVPERLYKYPLETICYDGIKDTPETNMEIYKYLKSEGEIEVKHPFDYGYLNDCYHNAFLLSDMYNFDYKTVDKSDYRNKILTSCFNPEEIMTGNNPFDKFYFNPNYDKSKKIYADNLLNEMIKEWKDNKIVCEAFIETDPSLTYELSTDTVSRVTLHVKYTDGNDNYLKSKGIEKGKWYERDFEITSGMHGFKETKRSTLWKWSGLHVFRVKALSPYILSSNQTGESQRNYEVIREGNNLVFMPKRKR